MIRTPFPPIAGHILQSPGGNRETSHNCCLRSTSPLLSISIRFAATVIRWLRTNRLATMKRRVHSRPAGIFPMSFARKAVLASGALLEPATAFHRIEPAHTCPAGRGSPRKRSGSSSFATGSESRASGQRFASTFSGLSHPATANGSRCAIWRQRGPGAGHGGD
jgi:hypothetical protein